MLFIKDSEKMQENYDLSVAALGPPQMASKFSYELRLFDEVGFAYRGPMLSAATPTNQFWTQVNTLIYPMKFILFRSIRESFLFRDITCIFLIWMFLEVSLRLRSEFFTEVKMFFDNSLVWKVIIYVLHVLSISVLTLACHRVMIIVTNTS